MKHAKQELPKASYLTVSALNRYIKRKFTADPYLEQVHVVGEVFNFSERPGGHQYFSLKDEHSTLRVVMFKRAYEALSFKLEEGMQIFVKGQATTYEARGEYQLIIHDVQVDGVGLLYRQLDERLKRYQAAGLFDKNKRPLPKYPHAIAVITSPTGAVVHDIITTLQRRYPLVEVTVFPTLIQGKEAKYRIAEAFQRVFAASESYDVIILARGGGSIEDLWPFNEEEVAQAILASPIPVISSIGHETDTTLADYLADHRAPTPTAAAELAVPHIQEELKYLLQLHQRLLQAVGQYLKQAQYRLDRVRQSYVLRRPEDLYQAYMQSLDHLESRLSRSMKQLSERERYRFEQVTSALYYYNPQRQLQVLKERVMNDRLNMERAMRILLKEKEQEFLQHVQLLNAYNPLQILEKGYALVEHEGSVLKEAKQVKAGDRVTIQLHKGQLLADVTRVINEPEKENKND